TLFGERWVMCAANRAELERALAGAAAGAPGAGDSRASAERTDTSHANASSTAASFSAASPAAAPNAAAARPLARGTALQLPPPLAWLLPGAGAARSGMGQSLYREWPVFRSALDAAFEVLDPLLERPLRSL